MKQTIRLIDLFAGIGGIRLGTEQALSERGLASECVLTSEIKPYAVDVLLQNHPNETVAGDITEIPAESIPDFDILCAGFPCQPFSSAGNRDGFADTRGTMFFHIERILREKKPRGFVLENVEGLANHDNGRTLSIILGNLKALGYAVSWRVLNASDFGVPQERRRTYIAGARADISKAGCPDMFIFPKRRSRLSDILESGLPCVDTPFTRRLLEKYPIAELAGKSVKDRRGGKDNIHSWDLEIKGSVSARQKELLGAIMTERRKDKWADEAGVEPMDGMPLTEKQIRTFFNDENLTEMLADLTEKGYMRYEHPKRLVAETSTAPDGREVTTTRREYDTEKEKGYNIVAGKLSFEVNEILNPNGTAPTLTATDTRSIFVPDGNGIRRLTLRECLRLFGYPDDFKFDVGENDGYDLLGNTVAVPVVKAVAERLIERIF